MDKDLLNLVSLYLNVHELYMLKDTYKLNVLFYCRNSVLPKKDEIWGFRVNNNDDILSFTVIGYLEIIKYLVSIGINYDYKAANTACSHGYLDIVQFFVSVGFKYSSDAIYVAGQRGHLEIVKYLISIGIAYPTYAINYAAVYGHLDIVKYFVSIGKKPKRACFSFSHHAMDCSGSLAICAGMRGHLEVTKYLYSVYAEPVVARYLSQVTDNFKPTISPTTDVTNNFMPMVLFIMSIACCASYSKMKL